MVEGKIAGEVTAPPPARLLDGLDDAPDELKKPVSLLLPISDWKRLRREAARRKIPMTRLCVEWITPHLRKLRSAGGDEAA